MTSVLARPATIPIGRFSRLTRLSIKALRLYDELGLLKPARIDASSGYRYYSVEQVDEAESIRRMRVVEMPLEEIHAFLRERNADARRIILERHRARLTDRLTELAAAVDALDALVRPAGAAANYDVQVREVPAQSIVSREGRVARNDAGRFIGETFFELYREIFQRGLQPAGPALCVWRHDDELPEEIVALEIGVPVPATAGSVMDAITALPAMRAACTTHHGGYEQLDTAYRAVVAWAEEHGHEAVGPPREVYLVGPAQAHEPGEYRTEVLWPIR
jgi:DNA-binding transcriptional MerR regulator